MTARLLGPVMLLATTAAVGWLLWTTTGAPCVDLNLAPSTYCASQAVRFGSATLLALASFFAAGFLGFLFAVPTTDGQNASNLERFSEWLTKIIIGAGLTQLSSVPTYVKKVAMTMQWAVFPVEQTGVAITISVIICFSSTGFVAGFYFSRTNLFQMPGFSFRKRSGDQK